MVSLGAWGLEVGGGGAGKWGAGGGTGRREGPGEVDWVDQGVKEVCGSP